MSFPGEPQEDRRWNFHCSGTSGFVTYNCQEGEFQKEVNYKPEDGQFIVGVESYATPDENDEWVNSKYHSIADI